MQTVITMVRQMTSANREEGEAEKKKIKEENTK